MYMSTMKQLTNFRFGPIFVSAVDKEKCVVAKNFKPDSKGIDNFGSSLVAFSRLKHQRSGRHR